MLYLDFKSTLLLCRCNVPVKQLLIRAIINVEKKNQQEMKTVKQKQSRLDLK